VVPVRDGARYLGEALDSVLAQDPPPHEIVVVDDGSVDDSATIAAGFGGPVRVMSGPPRGRAAARNRGVAAADGEVLGFLDADDVWAPGALATLLEPIERDPTVGVVRAATHEFRSPDVDPSGVPAPRNGVRGWLLGATLVRADAFRSIGPFREDLSVGEAVEWMARAHDSGVKAVELESVVLRRRLHRPNVSPNARLARRDLARAVKLSLDRRRSAG